MLKKSHKPEPPTGRPACSTPNPPPVPRESFRNVPSAVGAVKEAYRTASKGQRQQMRAWMRRVLADEDGNDRENITASNDLSNDRFCTWDYST